MLQTQTHHSHPVLNLLPWRKPLISSLLRPKQSSLRKQNVCFRYVNSNNSTTIKAISSPSSSSSTSSDQTTITSVKAVVTVQVAVGGLLSNLGLDHGLDNITDLFGKSILLELVSADLDPKTGLEKETIKGYAHRTSQDENEVKYELNFEVAEEFGEIGAVLVENEHHKEMYLKNIAFDGFPNGPVCVTCNSWVASKFDNPEKRIFFTNKSYLPGQTPSGLKRLRKKELENLQGDGQGERKTQDRIYDYDVYNDIGDPDSNSELKRPVLGGKKHPYPRRCRTGRPRCKTDPLSESRSSTVYVPRDEKFSDVKQFTFSAKAVYSVLHALVPSLETAIVDTDLGFPYFTAIDSLFNEGVNLPPLHKNVENKLAW